MQLTRQTQGVVTHVVIRTGEYHGKLTSVTTACNRFFDGKMITLCNGNKDEVDCPKCKRNV